MTSTIAHTNHQIRLARRPVGLPTRADWSFTAEPVAPPEAEGVLVKTLALSLDPAMRGWMNEGKSYIAPVAIDEVMRAGGIGVVVASEHPKFAVGDRVSGALGVQEYALFAGKQIARGDLVKIDLRLGTQTQWLNVLGMPGMTAYFGLLDVGQPKPGETVVVSGAAGAVGQTVGQLAKIKGCRAVGIAGGPAKCEWVVKELGFDACIDYKAGPIKDGLKAHCPKGVDVYFDNVGGEILDAVLTRLEPARADHHLRRDQPVQQHRGGEGPGQLPLAARQPRAHGRDGRVRLHRALSGGDRRAGGLPEGRPDDEPRGHRRRHRDLPRNAPQALSRRELRQARAAGRGSLTRQPAAPRRRLDFAIELAFASAREDRLQQLPSA